MGSSSKLIECYVHDDEVGVMLEIACETCVPKNDDSFRSLAHDLAMHIAAFHPSDVEELMSQPFLRDSEITVEKALQQAIVDHRENMKITRFVRWDTQNPTPGGGDPPRKTPAVAMRVVK